MRGLPFTLSLLAIAVASTACLTGEGEDGDDLPDGDGAEEVDPGTADAATPAALAIGFNDGHVEEFGYYDDFYSVDIHGGPRLCHAYFAWSVGNQQPHAGAIDDTASRAYVDNWFAQAQAGGCDEALISFKAMSHQAAPATAAYASAFDKFAAADWRTEAGFTGKLSFTPWNEPNNKADDGDGLGVEIDARLAARYYLAAERSCKKHGCTVAAGDFASNGDMWNAFEWNCANDNVAASALCATKSDANPDHLAASYLDLYKNEIVNRSHEYGMPDGFRPAVFAYHGWHDSNRYLDVGDHCSTYDTCALRRILKSLGGSWGGVDIWNTEDGAGQTESPSDAAQGCTAAFLVRLQSINPRVKRLYLTRLHGGGGQLLTAPHTPRPAMTVFAKRARTYARPDGAACR